MARDYKGFGNQRMIGILCPLAPVRIGEIDGKKNQTNKCGQVVIKPIQLVGGGQAQRVYDVKGRSICLSANGGGGGAKTGLYKIDLPDGQYTVRKLTPVECERLQTLPDNYTSGISNTQRYKCIGNGWTVDVIAHIFKGLRNNNV